MVRILIVEDELIIAEDVSSMLTGMGYEVSGVAMDYAEAIELITARKPDLILLDINLNSNRDGIQIAEKINESFAVPFIFTTSYSDSATLERAKNTNPANYLVKPFTSEQLFTAIEMALFKVARESASQTPSEMPEPVNGPLIISDALFIKDKFRYTKLNIADIIWMKSEGNYLELHTENGNEVIRASITQFMERLGRNYFFRAHKSYIINLNHLTKIEATMVYVKDLPIPLSKSYHEELIRRLHIV